MKKFIAMLSIFTMSFILTAPLLTQAAGVTVRVSPPVSRPAPAPKASVSTPKVSTPKSASPSKPATSKSTTTSKPKSKFILKKDAVKSKTKSATSSIKKSVTPTKPAKKHSSSFSSYPNTIMTATGTYLILDSLEDDGDPIYENPETGEKIDEDELADMDYEEVNDVDYQDVDADQDIPLLAIIICIIAVITFGTVIAITFTNWRK